MRKKWEYSTSKANFAPEAKLPPEENLAPEATFAPQAKKNQIQVWKMVPLIVKMHGSSFEKPYYFENLFILAAYHLPSSEVLNLKQC